MFGHGVFSYKNIVYTINQPGEYNILNSIAAIETGLASGLTEEEIQKGIQFAEDAGQELFKFIGPWRGDKMH